MLCKYFLITCFTFILSACVLNKLDEFHEDQADVHLTSHHLDWEPNFQRAGKFYKEGNYTSALVELKPLAHEGIADAQAMLGYMYLEGQGVAKDVTRAISWLKKAADQGVSESYAMLGYIYLNGGDGVERDGQQAKDWFLKASLRGIRQAQFQLAYLYSHGLEGVKQDPALGLKWYKKSAYAGYPPSQHNLALIFLEGKADVNKNPSEALKWFLRAAESNYERSQISLAGIYFLGEDIEQNLIKAYMWAFIASKNNAEGEGTNVIRVMEKYLKEDEIKRAEELAIFCLKTDLQGCEKMSAQWL